MSFYINFIKTSLWNVDKRVFGELYYISATSLYLKTASVRIFLSCTFLGCTVCNCGYISLELYEDIRYGFFGLKTR